MAQFVNFIVDGRILFDIQILARDIRLGLVVVIIGNEIFHRIIGEKLPKLCAKLGGKGLVVGKDQGGTVDLFDHVCHGEGLARARHAEKHLVFHAR